MRIARVDVDDTQVKLKRAQDLWAQQLIRSPEGRESSAIAETVPGVRFVSPTLNTRTQVVAETGNWNTQVQGTNADLPAIRSWALQTGSFFTPQDVLSASKVVVLESAVRDQLFGVGADPVGQAVRINNQPFQVVGVLTSKGQAAMGPTRTTP
jgi:putative ABC transport system permease protein